MSFRRDLSLFDYAHRRSDTVQYCSPLGHITGLPYPTPTNHRRNTPAKTSWIWGIG